MADVYTAKDKNIYIALSNEEKHTIFNMGATIINDVHNKTLNGTLPKRWNHHDVNALLIPLLCQSLETDGPFIDLMVQQIDKYDKALRKLYSATFNDVFGITVTRNHLTKEEVFARMEEYRAHKRKVALQKIAGDPIKDSGLFE